jgi:hypothetical protein
VSVRFRSLAPLLLACVLVGAAGCKTRPFPVKFNNDMARAIDKLNKAGKEFYTAVSPLVNGGAADPRDVRSKYQAVEKTLKGIKEEYEDIGPPLGTNWGSELMDRFTDFLDGQQTILDKYLAPIVQMVESGQVDPARVQALLDKVDAEEAQTRNPLADVQKKWAEEHNLNLGK